MEPFVIHHMYGELGDFVEPWLKPRRSWLNMAWTRGFVANSGFVGFRSGFYGKVEVQLLRSHTSYEIGRRY